MPASNLYHEIIQVEVRDQSQAALSNVQRNVEKTERSINRISANPFTITVKAVDMLSRPLTAILNSAKNIASRGITLPIRLANNAIAPFRNLMNDMKGMANQVFQGIGQGIGNSLFMLAGQGFGMIKNSIIGMNATLETSTLQFETLMGNADEARAHVNDLFQFAKKTPFETQPVIDASRLLRTFGGSALDTMDNLTLFGNASAATSSDIKDVSFWFGRAYAAIKAGQPFGEARMRLQELAILSPQAAQKLEQLEKAGAKGDVIWKAMTDDVRRFDGAMERQAGTWEGLTSTLSDVISLTSAKVFAPLFKVAKDAVSGLNDVLSSDAFAEWAEGFGNAVTNAIQAGGKLLGQIIDVARAISTAFSSDAGAMGVVYDVIRDIFGQGAADAVQPFLQKLMDFIPTLREVGRWIGYAFQDLMKGDIRNVLIDLSLAFQTLTGINTTGFMGFIDNLTKTLGAGFQTAVSQLTRLFQDLGPSFERVTTALSGLVPQPLQDFVSGLVQGHDAMEDYTVVDMVARGINLLTETIVNVVVALKSAWEWLQQNKLAQMAIVGVLAMVTAGVVAWGVSIAVATAAQIAAAAPMALWIAQMWLGVAAQTALNAVMMLNPFVLLAVLLVGLVAALVFAYNTSEDFRNVVNGAFQAVQTVVMPIIEGIGNAINWLWQNVIAPAIPAITKLWDDLRNNTVQTLATLPLRLLEIGAEMINGLIKGLTGVDLLGWIRTNITDKIPQFIKDALGIHSPSSVFADIGGSIIQGLVSGLSAKLPDLTAMVGQVGGALSGVGSAVSGAASAITGGTEIADYIANAAQQRGIDPTIALRVAQSEGGVTEPARRGTFPTGSSWWPFQLHYGGPGYEQYGTTAGMGTGFTAQTGFQPGDPTAWKASVDYALDYVKRSGWDAWYGARAQGITGMMGVGGTYDAGGILPPGLTMAQNNTGGNEYVLTPGQLSGLGGGLTFAPVFNVDASGAAPGVGEEVTTAIEEQASALFGLLGVQLRTAFGNLAPEGGAT